MISPEQHRQRPGGNHAGLYGRQGKRWHIVPLRQRFCQAHHHGPQQGRAQEKRITHAEPGKRAAGQQQRAAQ